MTLPKDCSSVSFFREAAPYIHGHRDKTFVIAFAGEVIELPQFRQIMQDVAIVATLGAKVVLVHGTRPQINARLERTQTPVRLHKGIRVTDETALIAAQEAIGFLRIQIENLLSHALAQPSLHSHTLEIVSGNFITAQPLGIHDGIDYGYSGLVRKINHSFISRQLQADHIILMSPLGYSPTGEAYNLRYEQVAITTAKALQADKLIFLSEQPLYLPPELTPEEAQAYRQHNELMPAVLEALETKVERIHLLNAQMDGALLLELYTRDGVGTLVAAEQFETLRAATVEDISGILDLIRPLEQKGTLIKRSREQLELEIHKFYIITRDREVIACVALYNTDDPNTVELACLAVNPQYRGGNRGDKLLKHVAQVAHAQGKSRLLVLTTQTTQWFRERGFVKASVDELPANKKSLYNYQRNSQVLFKQLP